MFGGHGHSHDGVPCHGHGGGGGHGHSHGSGFSGGAGDQNAMMAMMANAMKSNNQQMTPQMMEFAKKMFEQRQMMVKQYMEQQQAGTAPSQQQFQDIMMKAAQEQAAKFRELQSAGGSAGLGSGGGGIGESHGHSHDVDPLDRMLQRDEAPGMLGGPTGSNAASLLNANLNSSKLNELINGKDASAKQQPGKDEDETKILDAISKKDYSQLDAIKATQYGVLDRLKELVESGQCDPNKPDAENVYLLHCAAINNRLDIAKYLVSLGVSIDAIGGELESTPMNWAARSGHVHMVIFLMNNGASPYLFDVEGFSTLHLATMFGHSNVVAYLLAKGLDADIPDKQGATSLMYAAQRIHSRDPAQLLLTFNARLNTQDSKGNTPLHYCVAFNNTTVMQILLEKGASLDIRNLKDQTPFDFAIERKKHGAINIMSAYQDDDRSKFPPLARAISSNKDIRKLMTKFFPFFILFYFGILFESNVLWIYKAIAFALAYLIAFAFKLLFFDRYLNKYVPIATTFAFIFWLYVTWFVYFRPYVFDFSLYSAMFAVSTYLSWYNLYKAWKTDPGILSANRDQMNKTILQFVEQNEFTLDQFCTACIIRKPLRSKHCAECDHCVAKFDHHCPWVDNCIGQNNLKYFFGFIFWTPVCLAYFVDGAIQFYKNTCWKNDLAEMPNITSFGVLVQFCWCSPWVAFFTLIGLLNLFWISCLCICHFYQAAFLGLTTNERMNYNRYKHFFDKSGTYRNPFNFGVCQNFVDLIDMNLGFWKPSLVNWKREHDIQDLINSRLDKKKEMGNKYMMTV